MIKTYLGLLIFFAVQHQISSLSAHVDHRKHTQKIIKDSKYMMKELQNIQRRSDIRQDSIDNYDLIVTEPLIKPALRHRHRHHRFRSGRGPKVPTKNENTHKPLEKANAQRKNYKLTGNTNMTQIQRYKYATTNNDLNEYQRGGDDVATTDIQKEKDDATENGLYEHRSGRENEATTLMQKDKDAVTKNYFSEHRKGNINEETTHIQKYKDATTKSYLYESPSGRQNEAITQTQEDKDATTTNYLNENRSGRQNEATTLMQKDKDAVTKNYFSQHRKGNKNEETTLIQKYKNATTRIYLNENQKGEEKVATTQTQEDKDATTTNYLNENWREGEKIAATPQKLFKKRQKVTPKGPFYRRVNYLNDQERNKPQKWVHCLDLVGPRLKGYKDNWRPVEKNNRNAEIRRLGELVATDVSKFTESEIISLLSHISDMDIRLFQWDYTAVTTILNIIIRGPIHSFRRLKRGVKEMFERWHLDISDMLKTFLEQTRIFRPPCIDISGNGGITKKAGGILLFTKPDKPTKKHRGPDESCHSPESTTVNNNE